MPAAEDGRFTTRSSDGRVGPVVRLQRRMRGLVAEEASSRIRRFAGVGRAAPTRRRRGTSASRLRPSPHRCHRPFLWRPRPPHRSIDCPRRDAVHYRPSHRLGSRSRPTAARGDRQLSRRMTVDAARRAVSAATARLHRCGDRSARADRPPDSRSDDAIPPLRRPFPSIQPARKRTPGRIRVGRSAAGSSRRGATTSIPRAWRTTNELEYASRQLTAIEINATYYRLQKPASFAKWRDATPRRLRLHASRDRTTPPTGASSARRAKSIGRFIASGLAELGAQARADRLAVRADQGLRCRRLRGLPEAAAGRARTACRCAMRSRCGTRAS